MQLLTKAYSHFIVDHFKAVLIFLFLFTSTLGYYALKLDVDASAETLLLENDTILKETREIHSRYVSPEYLVVSFSPKEYLLSSNSLNTIKTLKSELLKIEGVEDIISILDVPLLQSPPKAIKDLVGEVRTLESENIDTALVQKEFTTSPLYKKNLVSEDFKTTAIAINLKEDKRYTELLNARNTLLDKQKEKGLNQEESQELQNIKKEFKEHRDIVRVESHILIENIRAVLRVHHNEGELFLGGILMIADDMIGFVKGDIAVYGTSVILTMILVLWILFRQLRYVFIPIIIAFSSVVITAGFYALLGFEVTVISSNFVSMQLIMAISLAIHFVSNYRENFSKYPQYSQKELIIETMDKMLLPMGFVVTSSVVAYMSLISSGILPVINFGWMMAVASCISFLFAITFAPTILMVLDKKQPVLTYDKFTNLTLKLANFTQTSPRIIYAATFVIVVFSIVGASQMVVENSFISYFKEKTEIHQGMKKIDQNLGGTTPLEIVVSFPKLNEVESTQSQVKDDFDGFEDEFNKEGEAPQYWFAAEKMHTIRKIHEYLEHIPGVGNVASLGTMLSIGEIIKGGQELDNFELALMYNKLPQHYRNTILSPYIDIKNNEARFVVRIQDSFENLRREELLSVIQKGLEENIGLKKDEFKIVGMMVLYNNMLQSLYKTQILTIGETVFLVGLMFLLLFKSLRVSIIALIVNIIPIGIVFGIMGVFDIPLDIMNITIAAIAFDMGLNNTVYYYLRFKRELEKDWDYVAAMYRSHGSIGNPMYYCSGVSVVGFLVLITSNFVPTVVFGLLTIVTIFVAIVADLLLSPLLVIAFKPFGTKKKV